MQYEVSAYARAGRRCRHNLNYWTFGDYLGIGAGAHSKVSFPHRVIRQVRVKQPTSYLQSVRLAGVVAETIEVSRSELPFEFMLNALRLNEGFPTDLFAQRTGLPISQIDPILALAVEKGLINDQRDRLTPTDLGRRFLSDLQAMFLPRRVVGRST